MPTPIEVDEAELVPAVTLPDTSETFPTAPTTQEHPVGGNSAAPIADSPTSGSLPVSPYLAAYTPASGVEQAPTPDAPSQANAAPTRKLAPSAAALLAAGDISALDDAGPAFVPRFEASTPTDDSDTTPDDAGSEDDSPLAHSMLEQEQEPAYAPEVAAPPSAPIPIVAEAVDSEPHGAAESGSDSSGPDDSPLTDDSTPEQDMATETHGATSDDAQTGHQAPEPETEADGGDAGAPLFPSAGAADNDDGEKDGGERGDGSGPIWKSTAFLVVLGLLVMAGVGAAIYFLFFKPANVELPAQTVVSAPPVNELEPIVVEDASAFLAAMPTTVGTWVLTDYTAQTIDDDAEEGAELPEGVVEHDTLTYSDGTSEIVVDAWQHFTPESAQLTFDSMGADGTDQAPVLVDGQEVGTQVTVGSDASPNVVWSNGTAVFSAAGADTTVFMFVNQFGF